MQVQEGAAQMAARYSQLPVSPFGCSASDGLHSTEASSAASTRTHSVLAGSPRMSAREPRSDAHVTVTQSGGLASSPRIYLAPSGLDVLREDGPQEGGDPIGGDAGGRSGAPRGLPGSLAQGRGRRGAGQPQASVFQRCDSAAAARGQLQRCPTARSAGLAPLPSRLRNRRASQASPRPTAGGGATPRGALPTSLGEGHDPIQMRAADLVRDPKQCLAGLQPHRPCWPGGRRGRRCDRPPAS